MILIGSLGYHSKISFEYEEADSFMLIINSIVSNDNFGDRIIKGYLLEAFKDKILKKLKELLELIQPKEYLLSGMTYDIMGSTYTLNTKEDPLHREIKHLNNFLNIVLYCIDNKTELYVLDTELLDRSNTYFQVLKFVKTVGSLKITELKQRYLMEDIIVLIERAYIVEENEIVSLGPKGKFYCSPFIL